jgi:hypothetical protein
MFLYLTEHEISGTLTEVGAHPRGLLHQGAQRSGVASGASDVSSIEQLGRLRRPNKGVYVEAARDEQASSASS